MEVIYEILELISARDKDRYEWGSMTKLEYKYRSNLMAEITRELEEVCEESYDG